MWRREFDLEGPVRATAGDIDAINRVFSDAFTERYHRDGMGSVRVPELNPVVWRYALETAGDGALLWRDGTGQIAAFNMVHVSGVEGWMGPLAVRPDCQGRGAGRGIVTAGIELLQARGCQVIGLETMPRTIDNIGFYSQLGFRPGHLTISMARELRATDRTLAHGATDSAAPIDACHGLTNELAPGVHFGREIATTLDQALGGLTTVPVGGRPEAFALWHSSPLAVGRGNEELRALKIVARDVPRFRDLVVELVGRAAGLGFRRIAIRCQTAHQEAYSALLSLGFRVQWTDLRMALEGFEERPASPAIVFSNWEI